jgi:hypothetical protein
MLYGCFREFGAISREQNVCKDRRSYIDINQPDERLNSRLFGALIYVEKAEPGNEGGDGLCRESGERSAVPAK